MTSTKLLILLLLALAALPMMACDEETDASCQYQYGTDCSNPQDNDQTSKPDQPNGPEDYPEWTPSFGYHQSR